MGLFTLHNCCASSSLDYLKSSLESKSRLPIPEFSGYLCISKVCKLTVCLLGFLIAIARNCAQCLRHFIVRNCAIIANREAIRFSRNCAQLHATELLRK